tara:strand:+ start:133 stop:1374 length:1242 start_codon:yes stop_codon:yes gene_type:complete
MAGVSVDTVGLTFTRYLDGVVETLNHTSKSRNLVRKDDNWTGAHIEGRIHTARSTAIGYVEDGGAFPVADKQDYTPYKVGRKYIVGSIQLTDGSMATAAKSPNVARDVITSEVKGMMNNILKFENGMFFRDGTGAVATLTGGNVSATSTTNVDVSDARMLWDGGTYEMRDAAAIGTKHGEIVVSSVEQDMNASGNPELTIASPGLPASLASGDFLVWKGSVNRAITGLDKLISDSLTGTFQNVTTATYPRYSSLVMDNNTVKRDLTPSLFRQMLAGIMSRTGSERPADGLTVLCNSWQAINVEELYEGELRLTPDSTVGGLKVASFQSALGKIDIMVDTDCLYNKMFFADFSKIYRGVQKSLGWRREGGSIFKRSDTAGVWTATAMEIAELYIKERHTCGKIEDLNETRSTAY